MNTSEVLNKAADLIEERGWIQATGANDSTPWGGGASGKGPLCMEGGILAALDLSTDWMDLPPVGFMDCPAYQAVQSYLAGPRMIFDWNDAPGRTQAEVIEVLRAAAVIEAAREEQDAAWETYAELVSA